MDNNVGMEVQHAASHMYKREKRNGELPLQRIKKYLCWILIHFWGDPKQKFIVLTRTKTKSKLL